MGASIKNNLLRVAMFLVLSTVGLLYLFHLHPKSIPEWMTIPILLIALALLLWRKSLKTQGRELRDVLIGSLFFGDGFAICWMKNKTGLLTSVFGVLFAVCLLGLTFQLIRAARGRGAVGSPSPR